MKHRGYRVNDVLVLCKDPGVGLLGRRESLTLLKRSQFDGLGQFRDLICHRPQRVLQRSRRVLLNKV